MYEKKFTDGCNFIVQDVSLLSLFVIKSETVKQVFSCLTLSHFLKITGSAMCHFCHFLIGSREGSKWYTKN